MLLPNGVPVVLEVDGKHHDANGDVANPTLYAAMAAADRELKLAGYHVFRFGGAELRNDTVPAMVKVFFEAMFRRLSVAVPSAPLPAQPSTI